MVTGVFKMFSENEAQEKGKRMNIEEMVEELRKVMRFKRSTAEGDLVLIVMENPRSAFYALVTGIERDTSKRDEWWHLTLHILTVPPQKMVWTLRMEQFTGLEIFTMGGEKRFVQAVAFDEGKKEPEDRNRKKDGGRQKSKLRLVK